MHVESIVFLFIFFYFVLSLSLLWTSITLAVTFAATYFLRRPATKVAESVNLTDSKFAYVFPKFASVAVQGKILLVFALLIEHSWLLRKVFRQTNRLNRLDDFHFPDPPTFFPIHLPKAQNGEKSPEPDINEICERTLGSSSEGQTFKYNTIKDYRNAYSTGRKTPLQVAENLIVALKSEKRLHAIVEWDENVIRRQAEESTKRFENGTVRSVLEGVPVSVKDQIDVKEYSTSKGRSVETHADKDATVIQRLREAGALLYGKANQTEMGIHVTGLNPNKRYGHCRNPYNPEHHTGGSSSGSGSAVGAGLGPVSIAADGGGSIRIPAAFCGQFGIKPTCGIVPLTGDTACYGSTVDVVGPVTTCANDAAVVMSIITGTDGIDPLSVYAPPFSLAALNESPTSLEGLRIGIYNEWFNDSTTEVVQTCRKMVAKLEELGAEIVEIRIPELDLMVPAHVIAITSEMYGDAHDEIRHKPTSFSPATRILFGLVGDNSATHYLQSAKVRTRMIRHFTTILEKVDLIVTPANGSAPPKIPPNLLDVVEESDIVKQDAIMRYMHGANLTGLPACVFPIGYTKDNVPIALQLIAGAYKEDLLLRVAEASHLVVDRNKPAVYFDLLK